MIFHGNKDIFKISTNHIDEMTVDQSVPSKQLTYMLESLLGNTDDSLKKLNLHFFRSGLNLEIDADADTNFLSVLESMSNEKL